MGLDAILIMVFAFVVLEIASSLKWRSIIWFKLHSEKLNWRKWAQLARSMFCSEHLKNAGIVIVSGLVIFWVRIPKAISDAFFGRYLESSISTTLAATAGILALLTFSANRLASWQEWLDRQGSAEDSDSFLGYSLQEQRFQLSANRYLTKNGFRYAFIGVFISIFAVGIFSFYPIDWKVDDSSYSLLNMSLKVWLISYVYVLLALIANLLNSFRLIESIEVKARIADRVFKDALSKFVASRKSQSRYKSISDYIYLKLEQVSMFPTAHQREIGIATCGLNKFFNYLYLDRNILGVRFYFNSEDEKALKAAEKYQKIISSISYANSIFSIDSGLIKKIFGCVIQRCNKSRKQYLLNKIATVEMLYSGIISGSIQFLVKLKNAGSESVARDVLEMILYHGKRLEFLYEQINELGELLEDEEVSHKLLFKPTLVVSSRRLNWCVQDLKNEKSQLRGWILIEDFLAYYNLPSSVKSLFYDTEVVRTLAESAINIRHADTRDSVMAAVMSLACRHTRNSKDSPGLSADFFNQYAVMALHRTVNSGNQKLEGDNLQDFPLTTRTLQCCAYRTLIDAGSSLSSYQTSILLPCISSWRPYASLLRNLLYERRSGRRLKLEIVEEYWKYFNDYQHFAMIQDGFAISENRVVEELGSPNNRVSHFVDPVGIKWLVQSLRKPLDIDMLREFINKRNDHYIEELDALDFILWHCAATLTPSLTKPSKSFIKVIEEHINLLLYSSKSTDSELKTILDETNRALKNTLCNN
ncbi:MAG: hypothetical protein E7A24_05510 [Varibaculum cambriense]|uniref:hypothetical protein n=1 Tax=Varibaculum cambriense TaxID=184870 RepID=UPI0029040973|nr:hypothetical protein [Varibaculum cambriense]MDU1051644.1 hypothetical protein [Varibaculum cambriense]